MKGKLKDLAEESLVTNGATVQTGTAFLRKKDGVSHTASSLRLAVEQQDSWWETGWFKEWERVARPQS